MNTALILLFIVGYGLITLEHTINLNKTATALLTGVLCWAVYALADPQADVVRQLTEHLSSTAEILFFLLGAMTVVELIDAHDGFTLITDRIASRNTRTLLWIVSGLAFVLSALLDNLTTAIVMVSVARKLVRNEEQRRVMAGLVIIAANAGGAWSPIGDVTTTMLWIGGQITTVNIIQTLFLPSLVSLVVPVVILTWRTPAEASSFEATEEEQGAARPYVTQAGRRERRLMLSIGLGGMLFVPIFKAFTGLPPYMGMMLVLGAIWVASEVIHKDKDDAAKEPLTPAYALSQIDAPSILFFLGILLAVGSLEATGILRMLAESLNQTVGNLDVIIVLIGLLSAVVDNVPIVAAAMGMYDLAAYPPDHKIWEFLAYCAGTGGSILIIGSAAGVAVMGMERLSFGWYLRKISWLALVGYLAGAATYLILWAVIH